MVTSLGPRSGRRRRPAWAPWAVAVLLYMVTAVVFTMPGMLPGRTMGGVDILSYSTPFRETTPSQIPANNPLQTDMMEQVPLVAEFWEAARAGDLQLWEPDHGAGIPLLTAVHNRVLAPANLAFAVVPAESATALAVAIALFLAQLGAFALARRLGLSPWAGLLAGVAYGFSGPVTALLLRVHEASMLPWVLLAVHACFASPRRRAAVVGMAVATAGTLLSGFPAATLHVVYIAAAFGIWLAIDVWRRDGGTVAVPGFLRSASGALLGGLLTAPILLPTARWLRTTGALERTYDVTDALGLELLATAVSGRFFGAYQDGDFQLVDQALVNPVEASMTMGLVVLALLAAAAWDPPRRGAVDRSLSLFLVPAGLVVLVAVVLGGPVLGAVQQLPYMDANLFGRSRFIVSLVVALLAGVGLDRVRARLRGQATPRDGGRELSLRVGASVVLAMVGLGTYLALSGTIVRGSVKELARDMVLPSIALAVAVVGIVWARASGGRTRHIRVASAAAIVALAVELQAGAWGFVSTAPDRLFYPRPDLPSDMAQDIGPAGDFRFAATSFNVLPPHAAGLLDLNDLRVAYPAYEPWRRLLREADPGVFDRRRLRTIFTEDVDWTSPVFDRLSVRWLVHPLRDPLLDVGSATQTVGLGNDLSWQLPDLGAPLRGVRLDLDLGGCRLGWVDLVVEGRTASRRLAREVGESTIFPLSDIPGGGQARLEPTDCEVVSTSTSVAHLSAGGAFEVVSTDGLVIYRRPEARPRFELAPDVVEVVDDAAALREAGTLPAGVAVVTTTLDLDRGATGSLKRVRLDPDESQVRTQTTGRMLLVARDVNAPGWVATIDGVSAPVVTVDHALRGVVVPSGTHDVAFRYEPPGYRLGLRLAIVGLVGLLLVSLVGAGRRRRTGSAR